MEPLDAFPFDVEVWSFEDRHSDERLGVAKNVTVAQAAYSAALDELPDRIFRLRIRGASVEERIPS